MTSLEHQALSDEGLVVMVLGESFECWNDLRMAQAAAGVWTVLGERMDFQETCTLSTCP